MANQRLRIQGNGLLSNSKKFKKIFLHLVLTMAILLVGIPLSISSASADSNSFDFQYTGAVQSWSAPYSGKYKFEVWGAEGGRTPESPGTPGKGGYAYGEINLTKGQTFYLYVGKNGNKNSWSNSPADAGWNGGGNGAYSYHGGAGGGATDIRSLSDGNWQDDLNYRAIVAGGGGGVDYDYNPSLVGGYGGGWTGGTGTSFKQPYAAPTGATQLSGGSGSYSDGYYSPNGSFGKGGSSASNGGGGWYGGGASLDTTAGGGGSSYVAGNANSPTPHPDGITFSNSGTIPGNQSIPSPNGSIEIGHSGNGYARITFIQPADTTPPVTSDNAPKDWVNKDVTVTLTASDNGSSGVASTYYKIDNGSQQSGTSVNITDEGVHNIMYWSVDNAGNVEKQHTATVKIDKTAPVTTDDAPKEWVNKDVTVNLAESENGGSGVASTYYQIDNGSAQSGNTITISAEGVHTITYWSVDNVGNVEAQHSATVKIDKTTPVTTEDAPKDWVNKDVTVNLTATDGGSGVASTYYQIDNGFAQSGNAITISAEGVHTITYWSVDNSGNSETKHTATVKIDKAAPITTLATNPGSSPNGKNDWYISDVQVDLNATDSGESGVANTEFRINGGAWTAYTGSFNLTNDGTYTIDYRSTDKAGNVESYNTKTIKLDKTAPVLNISLDKTTIWPPNHKMVPVTVTINSSDAISGIDSVVLKSITSNETLQPDDIQNANYNKPISGSTDSFYLRAERLGNGRIYTITYTATDKAGNVITKSLNVTVPHDQSKK